MAQTDQRALPIVLMAVAAALLLARVILALDLFRMGAG
jgi:hypothetical protein